jgi:hypothetical protein
MKSTSPPAMCLITLFALTASSQAAYISGSTNFSSAAGGGIVLQDSAGNITTNLANAAGIRLWTFTEMEQGSGSFGSLSNGAPVFFVEPWVFGHSVSAIPLWQIAGPENFTFNLTSSDIVYQSAHFLAIYGTGFLTATGFEDTPASWWFSTQGVAAGNKFSWSSAAVANTPPPRPPVGVPDGGSSLVILCGSLLGILSLRCQLKNARLSLIK